MTGDWLDCLFALLDARARFLVVGAHAMAVHGVPRGTQDLDLLIDPVPDNADAGGRLAASTQCRIQHIVLIPLVLVALAATTAPAPDSPAGRCFTAKLGKWSGEPTRPPLPKVFRLDTVPDPLMVDSAGGYRQIVPDWTETPQPRWPAGWRLIAGDSLELRWSLGVIGIRIIVPATGDTLRGRAVTFGDEENIPPKSPRHAKATVVAVSCSTLWPRGSAVAPPSTTGMTKGESER